MLFGDCGQLLHEVVERDTLAWRSHLRSRIQHWLSLHLIVVRKAGKARLVSDLLHRGNRLGRTWQDSISQSIERLQVSLELTMQHIYLQSLLAPELLPCMLDVRFLAHQVLFCVVELWSPRLLHLLHAL